MQYEGPDMTQFPLPTEPYAFVDDFRVGIIKAELDVITFTGEFWT